MRFPLREQLSRFRQSLKFHYLWRSFFFDRAYAGILRVSEKANWLSFRILVVYVSALALLIVTNGIARLASRGGFLWVEELSSWLLIGIVFAGSGLAIKKGLHVGITIIIEYAPASAKRPLVFLGNFLVTVFLLCVIGISFVSALRTSGEGAALKIPLFIPYMQVPVGGILVLLQMLPFLTGPLLKSSSPESFLLTRILPEENS
ncbi:MAG: TRAP transporter small permease subunit [Spirochaetaceae bacterium]|nr:TRAP transporter small permease subunit [Spirochaetaceae bacterium]